MSPLETGKLSDMQRKERKWFMILKESAVF